MKERNYPTIINSDGSLIMTETVENIILNNYWILKKLSWDQHKKGKSIDYNNIDDYVDAIKVLDDFFKHPLST